MTDAAPPSGPDRQPRWLPVATFEKFRLDSGILLAAAAEFAKVVENHGVKTGHKVRVKYDLYMFRVEVLETAAEAEERVRRDAESEAAVARRREQRRARKERVASELGVTVEALLDAEEKSRDGQEKPRWLPIATFEANRLDSGILLAAAAEFAKVVENHGVKTGRKVHVGHLLTTFQVEVRETAAEAEGRARRDAESEAAYAARTREQRRVWNERVASELGVTVEALLDAEEKSRDGQKEGEA